MDVRIRETTIDDVEQIDRVRGVCLPWHTASVETQRIWWRTTQPAAQPLRLCAEVDNQIVAFAYAGLEVNATVPGAATISAFTDPAYRGAGIGRALYAMAEEHIRKIGGQRIQVQALDEPAFVDWAIRLGYELGASERFLVVDPRELPPMPSLPAGVSVVTANEAGPEAVYTVDNVAGQDEPNDLGFSGMSYSDWHERYWHIIDRDVSMVAMVDGQPAAITLLDANRATGRAMSNGSGTLREYRGRGLMKVVKSASLRRVADAGITAAFTANDDTNKPMLAVNEWLGYRYLSGIRSLIKSL